MHKNLFCQRGQGLFLIPLTLVKSKWSICCNSQPPGEKLGRRKGTPGGVLRTVSAGTSRGSASSIAGSWVGSQKHRVTESQAILMWKGSTRIVESDSWPRTGHWRMTPWAWRALSKRFLSSVGLGAVSIGGCRRSDTSHCTFAGFGTFSGPRGAQAAAAPPRSRRAAALPASRGRRSTRAACRRPGRRRHGHGGRDHPHRQEDGQDGAEEERGERRDGTGREADRRRCRRPRRGPGRRRALSFPQARGLSLPAAALPGGLSASLAAPRGRGASPGPARGGGTAAGPAPPRGDHAALAAAPWAGRRFPPGHRPWLGAAAPSLPARWNHGIGLGGERKPVTPWNPAETAPCMPCTRGVVAFRRESWSFRWGVKT